MANPDFADLDKVDYSKYQYMLCSRPDPALPGLLQVQISNPKATDPETAPNALPDRGHREAGQIWVDISRDPTVSVVVLTARAPGWQAAGNSGVPGQRKPAKDPEALYQLYDEARAIVRNMVDCNKIIISAVNGLAVGAGAALALMADISVAAENAKFGDGHTNFAVAAGDHACMIWPLLCGMAKTKYYVLTGELLDAKEAERIGLVSKCVPEGKAEEEALRVGRELAAGPQHALKHTKRALNTWLNQSGLPAFDFSCALEMLDFQHPDVIERTMAAREGRKPNFPSAKL